MAFFWIFAGAVELLLGPGKFLVYTLLSAMVGDFLFSTYVYLSGAWAAATIGSQGMVLAVMGMFVFLFPGEKMRFKRDAPNPEDVTVIDLHPVFLILIFIVGISLGFLNPTHDALDFYSYATSLGCGLFCGMAFFREEKAGFKVLTIKAIG
jgi:membrane associated rhomboid family serine protease